MDDAVISRRGFLQLGELPALPSRLRHVRKADGDGYGRKNSDWIKINFKFKFCIFFIFIFNIKFKILNLKF